MFKPVHRHDEAEWDRQRPRADDLAGLLRARDATHVAPALIEHPAIQGICLSTLGEGYTHEGGDGNFYTGDTGWHSDCGVDWEQKSLVPCLKIAFYLGELIADSGAVRLIPSAIRTARLLRGLTARAPSEPRGFYEASPPERQRPGRRLATIATSININTP